MGRGRKSISKEVFTKFIEVPDHIKALKTIKSAKKIFDEYFLDWAEQTNNKMSYPPFLKEYNLYMVNIPADEVTSFFAPIKSPKLHYSDIYEMITMYTQLCQEGQYNSLTIYGTSGVGKTYTTIQATQEAILKAKTKKEKEALTPLVLKGAVKTTRDLVTILYNYREGRLLIFDDFDIKNGEMKNILKTALEDSKDRTITYLDDAKEIPNHFKFSSRIIFITNMKRLDPALKDRGAVVKMDLTKEEILHHIKDCFDTFLAGFPIKIKMEVWNFLFENKNKIKDMSFRKFKIAVATRLKQPEKWKQWVMYTLNS